MLKKLFAFIPKLGKLSALPLSLLLLFLLFALASSVLAGDARLYLSPSSGTKAVGAAFSVTVRVNSGSHTTNAYKAVLAFPTSLLSVTSVSVGGSICTLQITGSPGYSNSAGTVNFECGHPGSFSGTAGTIGTVTFNPKASGTATISFTQANIKAADGYGTEVLGSTGGATFNLQVSGPVVSSSTHPDQNAWYSLRSVALSWTTPPGASGFSYVFDNQPATIPDNTSEGTGTSGSFTAQADGIYYFHIKARGTGGWGATTHFRIQIDTTPPDPFEVIVIPPADNVTSAPLINAEAKDRPSGIDHYEISLDGGPFEKVPLPYQFDRIPEGEHVLTVRAVDKAGNYRDSSVTLYVIDVPDPVIERPADGSYLPILEELFIKGTAPEGRVEIYLNDELIAIVESDGTFEFTYPEFLRPGTYRLRVFAITGAGIVSSPAEVTFTVDPRAVSLFGITFPGWLVYSLLLGIIILLLILLWRYLKKITRFDEHVRKDIERAERKVEKELEEAEKELEREIEKTLHDGSEARMRRMEHKLEKEVEETEEKAERDLISELEEIKKHHRFPGVIFPDLRGFFRRGPKEPGRRRRWKIKLPRFGKPKPPDLSDWSQIKPPQHRIRLPRIKLPRIRLPRFPRIRKESKSKSRKKR